MFGLDFTVADKSSAAKEVHIWDKDRTKASLGRSKV